jgi:hypothetical protein
VVLLGIAVCAEKGSRISVFGAGILLSFFYFRGFGMICYLNRGFILEQAIVASVNHYFDAMRMDKLYSNFHTKATIEHPFAQLFVKEQGLNAADVFPVVVVSTYDDGKPSDIDTLPPQISGIGLGKTEIEIITKYKETVTENGKQKERMIPGLFPVAESSVIQAVNARIEEKGIIYGFAVRTYRKDKISLEVWAENAQLKNEIYDHLRLFVLGNLRHLLIAKYSFFDVKMDDDSINGQRSGAYNDQFDVVLYGANITFDVNYAVEQIVLDTEIEKKTRDLIMEVCNHAQL